MMYIVYHANHFAYSVCTSGDSNTLQALSFVKNNIFELYSKIHTVFTFMVEGSPHTSLHFSSGDHRALEIAHIVVHHHTSIDILSFLYYKMFEIQ